MVSAIVSSLPCFHLFWSFRNLHLQVMILSLDVRLPELKSTQGFFSQRFTFCSHLFFSVLWDGPLTQNIVKLFSKDNRKVHCRPQLGVYQLRFWREGGGSVDSCVSFCAISGNKIYGHYQEESEKQDRGRKRRLAKGRERHRPGGRRKGAYGWKRSSTSNTRSRCHLVGPGPYFKVKLSRK